MRHKGLLAKTGCEKIGHQLWPSSQQHAGRHQQRCGISEHAPIAAMRSGYFLSRHQFSSSARMIFEEWLAPAAGAQCGMRLLPLQALPPSKIWRIWRKLSFRVMQIYDAVRIFAIA
jgi:hypothetical protein